MELKLSEQERKKLIATHKKERHGCSLDRIKAVLLRDKGYTYQQIAEIFLLDDETVHRHIYDYSCKNKISPENGGSKSYLDDDQTSKLIAHLESTTYLYAKDICAYVQKEFSIRYTVSGMIKWLQKNSFRHKRPHGVPAKADLKKQEEFITKYIELKKTVKTHEIILFGDSAHPQHQKKLSYGWIKKGVRKFEKMTACQKRINIIGAINLKSHHVEYCQVDWVNTKSLKTFIVQLCAAYPNSSTIHLILDNAGYPKSEEFLRFVEATKIKIHYLAPYSPNLNPIERLWKVMHENTTYNRYYARLSEFTEGIIEFFQNIGKYKSIIQARINDNFQTLNIASSS